MSRRSRGESKVFDDEEETRFVDGSKYKGSWSKLGIDGVGRYVLPHNIAFRGEFRDGTFHGRGTAYWPRGQRIDGVWLSGELKGKNYTFADGLKFREDDWLYCRFPDRRYQKSIENGLRPAGDTLQTNSGPDMIPAMCYDAGYGIYDPRTGCVTSYQDPNKVLEIPTTSQARWIEKNCRRAWTEPTGHRVDLYENWFSQTVEAHASLLPFTTDSFESWWKRLPTFEREDCLASQQERSDVCVRRFCKGWETRDIKQ